MLFKSCRFELVCIIKTMLFRPYYRENAYKLQTVVL